MDLGNIPPEGIAITDLADFAIRFSGGIESNDTWPIAAEVDGLEVDLGKLANGEFPITNLDGFEMGVEPFELVPGFEVGGGLELGTIDVDGDPAEGEQIETVFYGRIYGQFEYEGLGAGVDLVVSQYGPVLAKVLVPVGIPIDGGLLGGVILSGVQGGLAFGGEGPPDPETPLDILHDPAFDTDFPVNDDTIRASVEPAVQVEEMTWDNGFTLALSGKLTHAMAPAIVSGDVTIGAHIGFGANPGLKFIGSGDISAWGMEFAGAALLIDLTEVLEPTFDFAFETPQPGNPLSFLLPAQATFEASLDTKGVLPGFALGVATFVDRAVSGTLEVGQDFFDATLDALADQPRRRPHPTARSSPPRHQRRRRGVGRRGPAGHHPRLPDIARSRHDGRGWPAVEPDLCRTRWHSSSRPTCWPRAVVWAAASTCPTCSPTPTTQPSPSCSAKAARRSPRCSAWSATQ